MEFDTIDVTDCLRGCMAVCIAELVRVKKKFELGNKLNLV